MTMPGGGTAPVSLSVATSLLLGDGWHDLAPGTLGVVIDPAFTDPQTGSLVVPGEQWVQFADTSGQALACPFRAVMGVKLAAPVSPQPPPAPPDPP